MESFEVTRRFPRLVTDAPVLYASSRDAGRARLCDISQGGLGLHELSTPLPPGRQVPITISIGLNRVGPLEARVVWCHQDRAGLELDWSNPTVARQISLAIEYLQPLT